MKKSSRIHTQPVSVILGWGCSSVCRASDHDATEAGLIPQCGEGFFSQSQLSVQTLLRCLYIPMCNCICCYICVHVQDPVVHVRVQWIMETLTPSMHRRLGSATSSQLAFSREGNPNFPWEKAHRDNTVVESKK